MTFQELNIRSETLRSLTAMGVVEPTPIQAEATPHLLAGRDVVGQAQTGSGKTLAYSIPLVERCDPDQPAVQAMVLVPTRELAFQVGSVIEELSKEHRLRCAFLYGGRDVSDQQTLLASGPQVVIGTPGRLLDLLFRGNLRLNELRFLIIDEADEMFDEGFGPDVDQLLECILQKPQVALFSATIPGWVQSIATRRLSDPVFVRIDATERPVDCVSHRVIEVPEGRKVEALESLLRTGDTSLIFCRTKDGVERLASRLAGDRFQVASLRGNMTQPERERVMRAFRRGHPRTLVATNVAARGIDIAHISRVINYDLPDSAELLTHRLGRTGRMGRSGEAVTLLGPRERKRWAAMQLGLKLTGASEQWKPEGNALKSSLDGATPHAGGDLTAPRPVSQPSRPGTQRTTGGRPRSRVPTQGTSRPGMGRSLLQETTCEGCGQPVRIGWMPTPSRPAYCRECRELVSVAV